MPAAFAQRGTPTTHIGPYPAFLADRTIHEARAPCLVRFFLAGDDYVLADWCAPAAFSYQAQFEQVLATYLPAPATFVPQATTTTAPRTCSEMQHTRGQQDHRREGAEQQSVSMLHRFPLPEHQAGTITVDRA